MNNETKNKVALVTGGSQGIGKEIAIQLANEGITTWIASRTEEKINSVVDDINFSDGTAFGYKIDLDNPEKIHGMVDTIHKQSGQIDILINNAGIGDGGSFLWETDYKNWWKVMEVNVRAPMLLSNLVLNGMIEQDWGTIINLCSFAGIRPTPMSSAYGISKTALIRMSETLATSLKDNNIGVFPISPGLVRTEMTNKVPIFQNLPEEAWTAVEEAGKLVIKLISGKYHPLSGRFIHVSYNPDQMLKEVDRINEENVYTLRLAKLDGLEE